MRDFLDLVILFLFAGANGGLHSEIPDFTRSTIMSFLLRLTGLISSKPASLDWGRQRWFDAKQS
jgi:hypothetical protein